MATYKELQDQIAELESKAQEARTNELEKAVQQIKTLMQEYGITVDDLDASTKKKGAKVRKPSNVQFQDADGNTWSGRGRMPVWLKGKDKEKFRVS
jgi:DNA-binding protein H-NS